MTQQVEAAAVDRLLGDDVPAVRGQRLDRVGDRRRAGGDRQRRGAAFQGGDALLQHVLGAVGQPPVNVPGVRQAEAVRGVLAVPEDIGGGLVNRDGPGIGGRIGLFLSYVKLKRFKSVLAHGFNLLFLLCIHIRFCLIFPPGSALPANKKPEAFAAKLPGK